MIDFSSKDLIAGHKSAESAQKWSGNYFFWLIALLCLID